MNNKVDQLFKNKLSEHTMVPSEEAWIRVQSGLPTKKNKIIVYWRVAAVLALVCFLIGIYFFRNDDQPSTKQLAQKDKISVPETKKETEPQTKVEATEKTQPVNVAKAEKSKAIDKKSTQKKVDHSINEAIESGMQNEVKNEDSILPQEISVATEEVQVAQVTEQKKPIVIEFTLRPVNDIEEVAIAKNQEKEKGFKKLIEVAREVKNGETGFSNLREMKNELLAFEFVKEKSKRN
jgi:hypothetical protein